MSAFYERQKFDCGSVKGYSDRRLLSAVRQFTKLGERRDYVAVEIRPFGIQKTVLLDVQLNLELSSLFAILLT